MDKLQSLLKSRRFWAAAAGLIIVLAKDQLGLNLTEEQVVEVGTLISVWIFSDSIRKTD